MISGNLSDFEKEKWGEACLSDEAETYYDIPGVLGHAKSYIEGDSEALAVEDRADAKFDPLVFLIAVGREPDEERDGFLTRRWLSSTTPSTVADIIFVITFYS